MIKLTKLGTQKDWQGKKFWADCEVDQNGEKYEVSIWPPHPELVEGMELDAELYKNNKGYWGLKFGNLGNKPAWAKKENQIGKAMEKKEQSIEKFQASKEEGIAMSGSARDATLIVTTFYSKEPFLTEEEIKEKWQEWRKWLYVKYTEPFV